MDARRIARYALLAAAVLGLALLTRSAWIVALAALAAIAAALAGALWMERSSAPGGEPGDPGPDEPTPRASWIGHLERLVAVDLAVREHALSDGVVARIETAIDALRRLLPELNRDYTGSGLTWTVNRMASDYLPRIVSPYVALSPEARADHEAELLASLDGLTRELAKIEELVRGARVGDFQAKAAFLRARFLDLAAS